jgi:hypothetical protein
VRAAVLDAFQRASGDIVAAEFINYVGLTYRGKKVLEPAQRSWMYPMFPQPGQEIISRFEISIGGRPVTAGRSTAIQRPPPHSNGPFVGESTYVDYRNRTWSTVPVGSVSTVPDSQTASPGQLRDQIASGRLRITGYPLLRGHRAITLAPPHPDSGGATFTMWVDAETYLPMQLVYIVYGPTGPVVSFVVQFQVLPPTPANLKLLDLPIPAGFTHVKAP